MNWKNFRVLAVDPASGKTGYAILSNHGPELRVRGTITLKKYNQKDECRLTKLQNNIGLIAETFHPDCAIFEKAGPQYGNRIGGWKRHNIYVQAVGAAQQGLIEVLSKENVYGVFPQTWKQSKKKKITVREANLLFNLKLSENKDHDIADAIMLGVWFIERQRLPEIRIPPILECTI